MLGGDLTTAFAVRGEFPGPGLGLESHDLRVIDIFVQIQLVLSLDSDGLLRGRNLASQRPQQSGVVGRYVRPSDEVERGRRVHCDAADRNGRNGANTHDVSSVRSPMVVLLAPHLTG